MPSASKLLLPFLYSLFVQIICPYHLLAEDLFLYAIDTDIKKIILAISKIINKNVVLPTELERKISVRIEGDLKTALSILGKVAQISIEEVDNIMVVSPTKVEKRTKIFNLKYKKAQDIIPALISEDVKVLSPTPNIIVAEAGKDKLEKIERIISEIDRPPRGIIIESRIIELSSRGSKEIGNLLRISAGDIKVGFEFLSQGGNIALKTNFVEDIISFLESRGDAKIISSPKILTLDGEKAVIMQGISIPYEVSTQFTVQTLFQDAVLSLEVIPKIVDDRIFLETKVTKNFPTAEFISARGVPAISKNEVVSKIIIKEGETVLIGGIIHQSSSKSFQGVPFLSSIPILGFLFKNYKEALENREIVISLSPKILHE